MNLADLLQPENESMTPKAQSRLRSSEPASDQPPRAAGNTENLPSVPGASRESGTAPTPVSAEGNRAPGTTWRTTWPTARARTKRMRSHSRTSWSERAGRRAGASGLRRAVSSRPT